MFYVPGKPIWMGSSGEAWNIRFSFRGIFESIYIYICVLPVCLFSTV